MKNLIYCRTQGLGILLFPKFGMDGISCLCGIKFIKRSGRYSGYIYLLSGFLHVFNFGFEIVTNSFLIGFVVFNGEDWFFGWIHNRNKLKALAKKKNE